MAHRGRRVRWRRTQIQVGLISHLQKKSGAVPTFASSGLSPVRLSEGFVQLRGQAPRLNEIMDVYGAGDHRGGATRSVLDQGVRWMQPDRVAPDMKFGTALSFFTDVQGKISDKLRVWNYRTVAADETQLSAPPPDRISIPTWDDELYLEFYRGTYTTQAAQKANIRKIEEGMLNAEKCALLACLECRTYPAMSSISPPPPARSVRDGRQRADALCYTVFAGAITRVLALEYQVCAVPVAPKDRRGPARTGSPASQ